NLQKRWGAPVTAPLSAGPKKGGGFPPKATLGKKVCANQPNPLAERNRHEPHGSDCLGDECMLRPAAEPGQNPQRSDRRGDAGRPRVVGEYRAQAGRRYGGPAPPPTHPALP